MTVPKYISFIFNNIVGMEQLDQGSGLTLLSRRRPRLGRVQLGRGGVVMKVRA